MRSKTTNSEFNHGTGPLRRRPLPGVLLSWLILLGAPCTRALAQQPASTAPLFQANAQYVGGRTWADYKPIAGTGLTLNVEAGTVWCKGMLATYAGGTLAMTDATTNYVYLNPAANCVPASNTTGFKSIGIPLATVTTAGGVITSVTDNRSLLNATPSSGTVNVQDYGAVCDGTTDATASIQAALNAVGSRGGIVFFPAIGCTSTYRFGALTMPAMPHGWIMFLSDNDWAITHEIDWVDSNTAINGRAGSGSVFFQGRPTFTVYNGASLANAVSLHPSTGYYTGIVFDSVTFDGFTNGISYTTTHLVTLRNLFFHGITNSSLIASDFFGLEIDGGFYIGNSDGSTPSIQLLQPLGGGNAVNIHLHDFGLNYSGIYIDSNVEGANWSGLHIHDVEYENGTGNYAPFLTLGNNVYLNSLAISNVQTADPIGGVMWSPLPWYGYFPFINIAGSGYLRSVDIINNDGAGPVFWPAGTAQVLGARIVGYNTSADYQNDTGLTDYYQLTSREGKQAISKRLCLGLSADDCVDSYYGPRLSIAPENTETGLRIVTKGTAYSDALRVQDENSNVLFGLSSMDGSLASTKVKGSLQLTQLSSPGTPTVTPSLGGGTTWKYKITAYDALGNHTTASAEGQTLVGAATLDATHSNTLSWAVTPSCSYYKINRTFAGGTPATTGDIAIVPCLREEPNYNTMTYVDNGVAILDANAPPSTNTTGIGSIPTLTTTNPIGLEYGGTNQTSWTADRCVQVNSAGTALESAAAICGTGSGGVGSLNSLTAPSQTFASGTSGSDFNISSATSTHTFNLPTASGSVRGALSATDWLTFNGKAATGSCTNQVVTALTSGSAPTCTTLTSTHVDPSIEKTGNKNAANGYAGLDASAKLAASQLPAPGAATLGGVNSADCSATGHVQKINADGSITCSADAGGGATPRLDQVLDLTADKTFSLADKVLTFNQDYTEGAGVVLSGTVDAGSGDSYTGFSYRVHNPSATPAEVGLFDVWGYGNYSDAGVLTNPRFFIYSHTLDSEVFSIDGTTGTATFTGALKAKAGTAHTGTLTHSITTDRTWALPDANGTLLSTASGSYVKSVVTGFCTGTAATNISVGLFGLGRSATSCGAWSATGTRFVSPGTGTLKNFYVSEGTSHKSGTTMAWTVYKNGSPTSLMCTVGSGETACNDPSHAISVAAGDLITVSSGTTASSAETLANVSVSMELWN